MNEQKTESISPKLRHYLPDPVHLLIGGASVEPSESARTLGVELDSFLTMSQQVTSLCRSLNFHLYNRYPGSEECSLMRHVIMLFALLF